MSQVLKYFDHIKHNSGLETTVIEDMVPERNCRDGLTQSSWNIEDTLGMKVHDAGELSRNQESFLQVLMRVTYAT